VQFHLAIPDLVKTLKVDHRTSDKITILIVGVAPPYSAAVQPDVSVIRLLSAMQAIVGVRRHLCSRLYLGAYIVSHGVFSCEQNDTCLGMQGEGAWIFPMCTIKEG